MRYEIRREHENGNIRRNKANNITTKAKEEQQPKKEDKPKEYALYKYSKGISLAKQIILGNESVFLQIKEGKPVISPS